jgi:XTP/dITP diphosphohydrolase
MDVSLVTTNEGKVRETRALLTPFGVRVIWEHRAIPEPQAETLEEVVRAKLAAVDKLRGYVLVEDSGLFIPSLGGFPGVYSAHIRGIWGFEPIFDLLRRRPRGAIFRTVAGVRRGRQSWQFAGECRGHITTAPRGKMGFGFDPIFRPGRARQTFAEMTPDAKNRYSHRAKAMRAVGKFLQRRS